MSKYDALWEYVQKEGTDSFQLTFDEIQVGIARETEERNLCWNLSMIHSY